MLSQELLAEGLNLTHPLVIGELACGNLRYRAEILDSLRELPSATVAADDEVLALIEQQRLWGKGIGWIDAHLLASALLTGCRLWTLDRRLRTVATHLKVRAPEAR